MAQPMVPPVVSAPPKRKAGFVNEALVPWILENGTIVGLLLLRYVLVPYKAEQNNFVERLYVGIVEGLVTVMLSLYAQEFFASVVYRGIPYFSQKPYQNKPSLGQAIVGYLKAMLPSQFCSALLIWLLLVTVPAERYTSHRDFSFAMVDVPLFLLKLAVMRLVTDVAFYALHRFIHTKYLFWVHKQHHEHKTCHMVGTNLNFHFFDLFLEGFVPAFTALVALQLIGLEAGEVERSLMVAYMVWFSAGGHSGKPLPTLNYFPPLSIVTRTFGLDDNTVIFHDNHHLIDGCNYGVSQWCDMLAGTRNVQYYLR
ncbi:hypothetical protein DIPPA_30109 [Diplonema papillatum]|nr:hypothetical protein DIPPA_30109 [Diplonema papillatum]|eukprot:gene8479-13087_t